MLKLILELKVRRRRPFILLWEFWSLFWLIVNSAHEILREIGTIWIKSRPTYHDKLSRASRREKKKIHVMHIHVWTLDISQKKKKMFGLWMDQYSGLDF